MILAECDDERNDANLSYICALAHKQGQATLSDGTSVAKALAWEAIHVAERKMHPLYALTVREWPPEEFREEVLGHEQIKEKEKIVRMAADAIAKASVDDAQARDTCDALCSIARWTWGIACP